MAIFYQGHYNKQTVKKGMDKGKLALPE